MRRIGGNVNLLFKYLTFLDYLDYDRGYVVVREAASLMASTFFLT